MSSNMFGTGDLLEYLPEYKLLICRQCQYAVQKSAIASHLLRHKIYRGERQRLLRSIARLDLLEPDNVPIPAPGSLPVSALPVLSGYCCSATACRHLTVSSKRMKRHWSEEHVSGELTSVPKHFARPVTLQTFFRGTKVRYFEVTTPEAQLPFTNNGNDEGAEMLQEGEMQDDTVDASTLQQLRPKQDVPEPGRGNSPANFDLETLHYFHHFVTVTSLTLPSAAQSPSVTSYWQMSIVSYALQWHWLMCGLLAISAHHLAVLARDTPNESKYRDHETQFASEFLSGVAEVEARDSAPETQGIGKKGKKIAEQLACFLRFADWSRGQTPAGHQRRSPEDLNSIVSMISGCSIPSFALHESNEIPTYDDGRRDLASRPVLTDTLNSSDGENLGTSSTSGKPPLVILEHLRALPYRIAEALGKPTNVEDVHATLSAITSMVVCCEISFSSDAVGQSWQGMAKWLAGLPTHFNQMLSRKHPAALVVLAHWAAVLLKRAEHLGCWFLNGLAKFIVLQVVRDVSVEGAAVYNLVENLIGIVNQ